jgi:uncharacterized protein (TIGR01777 family)
MRILVTGGTGLVGRNLIPLLLERGDEVLCLSRDPGRAREVLPGQVTILGGDPGLPGDWQDRLATCDGVVNLAGASVAEGRWTSGRKQKLRRSRLGATDNVAQALAGVEKPVVLVSASAVGYYGDRGDEALDERSEPGQDFLAHLALEWEHTARNAESEMVRVVLMRIGIVLAPEGGALEKMIPPFKLGLGGPLGSGRQYFPWIHIRDLVRAIMFALLEPELSGPVNAVVPDPPTQGEFARKLGRQLGKSSFLPAPTLALKLLLGEKSDLLLASQRAVPNALKASGFRFEFGDLDKALADLL